MKKQFEYAGLLLQSTSTVTHIKLLKTETRSDLTENLKIVYATSVTLNFLYLPSISDIYTSMDDSDWVLKVSPATDKASNSSIDVLMWFCAESPSFSVSPA